MSDIFYIKINNGEDIVATVLDEDDEFYYITFPLKLIYSRIMPSNAVSLGLIPWVPSEELMNSIFRIFKINTITMLPAPEKLKLSYETHINLSKDNVATKVHELHDKLNKNPELFKLFMANTSNAWIN